MFQVISVSDAVNQITTEVRKNAPELDIKEIAYQKAFNRILARNISVPEDLPPFSRSTVDGFAVKAADTFGASESMPAMLFNKGKIAMGESAQISVKEQEVVEVATGGMLPEDTDAVVMLEDVEQFEDGTIMINKSVASGENVIQKGEDAKQGRQILDKGTELRSQDVGALAAMGVEKVPVYDTPVVGIISTGDELIQPEEPLTAGKIRDVNTWSFASSVIGLNASPRVYGIIPDEETEIRTTLQSAIDECHLVIISGGSSVGIRDLTARIIDELGDPGLLFHGVSIKPGKPTMFGMIDNTPVFGLSGNPVSALVTFEVLVAPAIRILRGEKSWRSPFSNSCQAVLSNNISSSSGREDYIRVSMQYDEKGILEAVPVLGESGLIFTLVEAHGLLRIPQNTEGFQAGEQVEIYKI